MTNVLHKKSIIQKTIQVGSSTLISRVFGLLREVLQVRYMGAGLVSDAFRSAWQLPNMLRQIFAEGALSAVMVPTVVGLVKDGRKKEINHLMALAFIIFEGAVLILIACVCWKARLVIQLVTPGFVGYQAELAAKLLRLLMPFIFFISSSALLAGPLQSVHHFFVPAFAQVLLNIIWIIGLLLGIYRGISIESFCVIVIVGGAVHLGWHVTTYFNLGFRFSSINKEALTIFKKLIKKFFPCTVSASVMQLSQVIDTAFASYLPVGSVSLISIASNFLRIPLGVFGVAFSTILLPHFSRVTTFAPKRLSFYLLEATKLIFWVSLPVALLLCFFSEKIFYTLFYSKNFSLAQVAEARLILSAFLIGLFFFSMNKILSSMYYAMHQMWIPAIIVMTGTLVNFCLNKWLVFSYQATGLAIATSTSAALQTILFIAILHKKFKFRLYHLNFLEFLYRYIVQITTIFSLFYCFYKLSLAVIFLCSQSVIHVLTMTIGFWFWAGPLSLAVLAILYKTRTLFNVQLHFLK